jgi:hypothetical protein
MNKTIHQIGGGRKELDFFKYKLKYYKDFADELMQIIEKSSADRISFLSKEEIYGDETSFVKSQTS